MLIDGGTIEPGAVLVADLCIVGSGPAGLTVARELAGSGLDVIVLERGGVDRPPSAPFAPALDLTSPWFPNPQDTLHHQVSGMAATWNSVLLDRVTAAARYLPLDPIDFERRHWVPNSGWPITFADLRPYFDRARRACGVDPYEFHAPLVGGRPTIDDPDGILVTRLDQLGPAVAFTDRSVDVTTSSTSVRIVHDSAACTVSPAEADPDGLARVTARSTAGATFDVRCRRVVLAAGAVETARLLLASTSQCAAGLGNEHDNVGRYFMEHPRVFLASGSFAPAARVDLGLYEPHERDGHAVIGKLHISEAVMRRERILNGVGQILPQHLTVPQLRGVAATRSVIRGLRRRQLRSVPLQTLRAARHLPAIARYTRLVRHDHPESFAEPGGDRWTGIRAGSFKLHLQPEQAPMRANRVRLGERVDAFGQRIAHLEWRWSDVDLRSIRRTRELFAEALRAAGVGELDLRGHELLPYGERTGAEADVPPRSAHHHLGSTRMHVDPRLGVVDRDCRLFNARSVFVCGGSVFTTGGGANPTLTIVALAIRLSDLLRTELGGR